MENDGGKVGRPPHIDPNLGFTIEALLRARSKVPIVKPQTIANRGGRLTLALSFSEAFQFYDFPFENSSPLVPNMELPHRTDHESFL